MMRYTPTNWQNQIKDEDGAILQNGTPLSAENMNKIESAVTDLAKEAHTHDNKELLDSIEEPNVHEHENKDILDLIRGPHVHTHSNKAVLEQLTQKHIDDSHTHANKAVLDKVTQKDLDDIKAHGVTLTDHEKRLVNLVESITSLKIKVVQTIAERDALTEKGDKIIHVVDASADPTVTKGWAQYIYQASAWVKIAENESIDVVLAWADITGKPVTFAPSAHTHTEKDIVGLDKYTKKEVNDLLAAAKTIVDQHMNNTTNPHGVTKAQIGLSNVPNLTMASLAVAEAGTSNGDFMSPLRTMQLLNKWAIDNPATETKSGVMTTADKIKLAQIDNKLDKSGGTIEGLLTLKETTLSAETITLDGATAAAMRVSNSFGYVNIAPMNAGWAHIYTDRIKFIFNKPVYSSVNAFSSYDADLMLQWKGTTKLTLGTTEATFVDKVKAPSFVQTDGKVIETTDGATAKVNSHANDKVLHITSAERVAWNGALKTLETHETKLGQLATHTHDYSTLTNKPTIPTKTSQLANDSSFIQSNAARLTVSATAPTNPQPNDIWIVI